MPQTKKTTKKTRPKKTLTTKTRKKVEAKPEKKIKYFEAVGRRKTATARVRLFTQGEKEITVNDKLYKVYFPIPSLQKTVEAPLEKIKCQDKFRISVVVKGGGLNAQAEATRHGITRTLVLLNPVFKKRLRKVGFLTRDPRMRERKKFGLKRARRGPQWSKR
ncbi:30S ribosomal protein S9 [Patescibacteria group bacterium]|nr:30S ribosomal protein S9 [Patescibacteria group bacterium]